MRRPRHVAARRARHLPGGQRSRLRGQRAARSGELYRFARARAAWRRRIRDHQLLRIRRYRSREKRAGRSLLEKEVSEGRRPERVAELLIRELSAMLIRDLKDPRLKGVTLTGAKMTDDLRRGRVLFSHLEGSERAPAVIAGFKSASGFIRHEIGHS